MNLRKFTPRADKRILVLLAGLMWCGVGVLLISYSITWLSLCTPRQQYLFYSLGFVAAMPIHHFGFLKIADKKPEQTVATDRKKMSLFFYDLEKLYNSPGYGFHRHFSETFIYSKTLPVNPL